MAAVRRLVFLKDKFIDSQDAADEYQFGFKKNHSTAILYRDLYCIEIFKVA